MLKPKSKSLVIAEPLSDELKEHIMMLEQSSPFDSKDSSR